MTPNNRGIRLALFMVLLSVLPAVAEPLSFMVVARDGTPVADAVISSGPRIESTAGTAEMDQVDKTFSPYVLAVGQGTAVNFPNSDQIRHHVYSFSEAKPFELRLYSGTPEAPVTFEKAGVVVVGCNIHDNMIGYIFVSPRAHWTRTDKAGMADLQVVDNRIHVWHPALSIDAQREISLPVEELEQTKTGYRVTLDIAASPEFPQAVKATDRDRFKRFID